MPGSRFRSSRRRAAADLAPRSAADTPLKPGLRERARLRRRVRELRALHELALRDLGGLVFDLYRFGRQRDALVRDKLERTLAVDQELRAIDQLLAGDDARIRELRLTGVGGTCPNCDEPFGSSARFCSRCGTQLDGALDGGLEHFQTAQLEPDDTGEHWVEETGDWTDEHAAAEPDDAEPPHTA